MKIRFLGTNSTVGNCPMLFATDQNSLLAVAKVVTDPAVLAEVQDTYAGVGDGETVVEIPLDLLRFAPGFQAGEAADGA